MPIVPKNCTPEPLTCETDSITVCPPEDDAPFHVIVDEILDIPVPTEEQTGLVPKIFDFIDLNYTGDDITQVIYKTGGSGGVTVATLAISYLSPGVINTVTRT